MHSIKMKSFKKQVGFKTGDCQGQHQACLSRIKTVNSLKSCCKDTRQNWKSVIIIGDGMGFRMVIEDLGTQAM